MSANYTLWSFCGFGIARIYNVEMANDARDAGYTVWKVRGSPGYRALILPGFIEGFLARRRQSKG